MLIAYLRPWQCFPLLHIALSGPADVELVANQQKSTSVECAVLCQVPSRCCPLTLLEHSASSMAGLSSPTLLTTTCTTCAMPRSPTPWMTTSGASPRRPLPPVALLHPGTWAHSVLTRSPVTGICYATYSDDELTFLPYFTWMVAAMPSPVLQNGTAAALDSLIRTFSVVQSLRSDLW